MESYPEQRSERARAELYKSIRADYSKSGLDIHELAGNLLNLRSTDDVLDVGCGTGEFLLMLRAKGHLGRLLGIDRSSPLIEEARREANSKGLKIDFRAGDACSIEFPSASYHCVTALESLEEPGLSKVLAEIGRVLKADGRVVIGTNSRSCYPILEELKSRARERFGWFLANEQGAGFTSEGAVEVLRAYFGEVEEFRFEDALRYPDAEVLVAFFRSARGLWNESLTDSEWERIVDWARDQAIDLIPERSYAEDQRVFSLFRCTQPLGF